MKTMCGRPYTWTWVNAATAELQRWPWVNAATQQLQRWPTSTYMVDRTLSAEREYRQSERSRTDFIESVFNPLTLHSLSRNIPSKCFAPYFSLIHNQLMKCLCSAVPGPGKGYICLSPQINFTVPVYFDYLRFFCVWSSSSSYVYCQ